MTEQTLDVTNTITCRDCRGKGMVTNGVTGEPDDCYTCGGSGVEVGRDCPDCDGYGWYARQIDDAGNAEQEQCRECHGTGAIPYRDAVGDDAITPDKLRELGFEVEYENDSGDSLWALELRNMAEELLFRVQVIFTNGVPKVRLSTLRYGESRKVPGCTTMTQIAQLVEMLGGEA